MDRDRELLQAFVQRGDREAFGRLIESYANLLYTVSLRVVNNAADAEEVVQEVCVRAMNAAPAYRGETSVKNWLLKIAFNLSLNRKRDRQRQEKRHMEYAGHQEFTPSEDELGKVTPILERGVATLDDELQTAVILHYYDKMKQHEIAEYLGCSQRVVNHRLKKAKDQLRSFFKTHGYTAMIPAALIALEQSKLSVAPSSLLTALQQTVAHGAVATAGTAQTAGAVGAMVVQTKLFFAALAAALLVGTGAGFVGNQLMNATDPSTIADPWPQDDVRLAELQRGIDRSQGELADVRMQMEALRAGNEELRRENTRLAAENRHWQARQHAPAKPSEPTERAGGFLWLEAWISGVENLLNNPDTRQMLCTEHYTELETGYSDFVVNSGMNAEHKERFYELLVDIELEELREQVRLLRSAEFTPERVGTIASSEALLAKQARLADFLAQQHVYGFEAYTEMLPERAFINEFSAKLEQPLTVAVKNQLVNAMHDERTRFVKIMEMQGLSSSQPEDFFKSISRLADWNFLSQVLEEKKECDRRISERVAGLLSRDEMELFLQSQSEFQREEYLRYRMFQGMASKKTE